MKKNLIYIGVIIIVVIIVFFIVRRSLHRNPLDVNVDDIELEVKLERFDKDLESVLEGQSYEKIENINEKYFGFYDIYNTEIIGVGGIDNSSYLTILNTFLNDYAVTEASIEVSKVFADVSLLNQELTDGFKHLLYYYPDTKVPRIVTFVAGFNQSIVNIDGYIGIGLDKYLGQNCELYDMLEIPEFAKFEMQPSQIPIDVMTALAHDKFPYNNEGENLLKLMIYNGQILYFLDAMYPNFEESRKIKYTEEQLAFCYKYEREIWTEIVENKFLFVTDYLTIKKFVEPAPFTSQFGPDSPPRIANWIGLQIVRSYMKNNDVSVQELLEETNAQKILNLSEYNP